MSSLPINLNPSDSSEEVRSFFDKYFSHQITFPVSQIDAVIGFFLKRGFSEESAKGTSIVLLNQSKIDNINVFKLLDTLAGLSELQLSKVVTEVLNANRERSSILGYQLINIEETLESRNIRS